MNPEHRYAAPTAAVLTLCVGVSQAWQDLRSDDWTYLAWSREHPRLMAFLLEPPPFPYFRPLNALCWQLQARLFGTDPWPLELVLLGLWTAAMLLLYVAASRRAGAVAGLVVVALALVTPEIRALPNWRSWLTTVGELAGLMGAVAFVRHPRAALPFAMLALGAAFKEGAWWQGALAMAALGRNEVAAASLAAYVVHAGVTSGLHAPGEIGLGFVPDNLLALGATLLSWGWPLAMGALALAAPREAWRDGSGRLALAGLLGTVPGLGFYRYSPYYMIEPLVLLMLGLVGPALASARRVPTLAWVPTLALAMWLARPASWADYSENIPYHTRRMFEGRALTAEAGLVAGVWAPPGDEGACGLAARLIAYDQRVPLLPDRPADGRAIRECLVVQDVATSH